MSKNILNSTILPIKLLTEDEEIKEYENKLNIALNAAGYYIQTYLDSITNRDKREWDFIQAKPLILPNFQHLCFRLGTNIYSIVIAIGNNDTGYCVDKSTLEKQIAVCDRNNLIPAIIPLNESDFSFIIDNSHLIHSISKERLCIIKNTKPQPMSYWEKLDFSIQIVRTDLERQGARIISYSSSPEMEINIWFEKDGKTCFAIVAYSDEKVFKFTPSIWLQKMMKRYEGFYTFFTMPGAMRGDGFYCKYDGLKPLADFNLGGWNEMRASCQIL